jgi:hypothetical protein
MTRVGGRPILLVGDGNRQRLEVLRVAAATFDVEVQVAGNFVDLLAKVKKLGRRMDLLTVADQTQHGKPQR